MLHRSASPSATKSTWTCLAKDRDWPFIFMGFPPRQPSSQRGRTPARLRGESSCAACFAFEETWAGAVSMKSATRRTALAVPTTQNDALPLLLASRAQDDAVRSYLAVGL